jgi:hypothetical protein
MMDVSSQEQNDAAPCAQAKIQGITQISPIYKMSMEEARCGAVFLGDE